uniref:Protein E6 n=1 Tax=Human papillomavirus TaxID=10566 RepID=A0A385PJD1_9PAPI|nr:MAG: E6 protein [Human papillomavirus]
MAVFKPKTVQELADSLGVPLVDLLLPCKFCGTFLPYIELVSFDYKHLQLIWTTEDFVFGSCSTCLHATAQHEFTTYFETSVTGREIEHFEQKPIGDIPVRCRFCFKLLDLIEKLDICYKDQQFHKVRRNWKGVCRHCGSLI